MGKHNVIIIDDEKLAIDVIDQYLSMYPNYAVVGKFIDPVEAISFINNNSVDLVLTDIAMPIVSGLDIVKMYSGKIRFVMTTSFSEYAIESFDLDVIDYLLKPIAIDRFSKALQRFEKSYQYNHQTESSFFVKDGEEFVKVNIDQIDYIEGMKDYAKIHCGKNFHMVLKTLKYFESFLKDQNFIRVHKSFIIPLDRILQYDGRHIIISDNKIPVGPSYRVQLKEFLNNRKI